MDRKAAPIESTTENVKSWGVIVVHSLTLLR